MNLVKKHWLPITVRLNIYYFIYFHANPSRTYYTYASDEIRQFASDHTISGRARICAQICLSPKATWFLAHQVYLIRVPSLKVLWVFRWGKRQSAQKGNEEGFVKEGSLELVPERHACFSHKAEKWQPTTMWRCRVGKSGNECGGNLQIILF